MDGGGRLDQPLTRSRLSAGERVGAPPDERDVNVARAAIAAAVRTLLPRWLGRMI